MKFGAESKVLRLILKELKDLKKKQAGGEAHKTSGANRHYRPARHSSTGPRGTAVQARAAQQYV